MNLCWDDTIAALASPPGPGVRGVVRLTGPDLLAALRRLFQAADDAWQTARKPLRVEGVLRWPECRAPIPAALQLWPTCRSYTGQPLGELHLIGSPPVLEAVLGEFYRGGVRPARPGEFTLRAFLAGRLDLVQAEAVLGVIDAHDQHELQTALAQLAGGVSRALTALRNDLLNLLADLEAGLDFVDEHLEFVSATEMQRRLMQAHEAVRALQSQSEQRLHHRASPQVVLAGLPNAGKSTLFNALVGRRQALVSPQAGTTRDYLTAALVWNGQPLELVDTAGAAVATDAIDGAAQTLGLEQRAQADLVVWCTPAALSAAEQSADAAALAAAKSLSRNLVRIVTKADLPATDAPCPATVRVSAETQQGLDDLRRIIVQNLARPNGSGRSWLGMTAARCRDSLHGAEAALARALELSRHSCATAAGEELLAVEIRDALEHLGEIVGAVYTNDLLDRIFSRFCIGK